MTEITNYNPIREISHLKISHYIIRDLLEDPEFDQSPIDVEHWDTIHDEIQKQLRERKQYKQLLDQAQQALEAISHYFTSSNEYPVEKAVNRTDSKAVQDVFSVLKSIQDAE